MRYSHIIFDIDGTIVDTERTMVLSLRQTVKDLMGRELSDEEALPFFGIPSRNVAGLIGYPDEREFLEEWEVRFVNFRHLITPFDGMLELILELHSAGAGTAVVTSRSHEEMNLDPLMGNILKDMDQVVCAGDSARPKPFPDPLLRYMELASAASGAPVTPGDCLYVGDTAHDFMCADGAGVAFALADWRRRGGKGIGCVFSFSAADELREFIFCK